MAPERPKTLTVLDYTRVDGGFGVHVDRWDPQDASTELVVTWAAASGPGPNWYSVANGAVWVAVPDGYQWGTYDGEVSPQEPNQLEWSDAAPGGYLMLVAVMPPGYVLDPDRGGDPPRQVKVVGNRLAAWWAITPRATRKWYVRELGATEVLDNVVVKLREHIRDDQPLDDPPEAVEAVSHWPRFRSPQSLPDEIRELNESRGLTQPRTTRDALVQQCLRVARTALVGEMDESRRRQVSDVLAVAEAVLRSDENLRTRLGRARSEWIMDLAEATGSAELAEALRSAAT
jgi:hypothetical protein